MKKFKYEIEYRHLVGGLKNAAKDGGDIGYRAHCVKERFIDMIKELNLRNTPEAIRYLDKMEDMADDISKDCNNEALWEKAQISTPAGCEGIGHVHYLPHDYSVKKGKEKIVKEKAKKLLDFIKPLSYENLLKNNKFVC